MFPIADKDVSSTVASHMLLLTLLFADEFLITDDRFKRVPVRTLVEIRTFIEQDQQLVLPMCAEVCSKSFQIRTDVCVLPSENHICHKIFQDYVLPGSLLTEKKQRRADLDTPEP